MLYNHEYELEIIRLESIRDTLKIKQETQNLS